MWKAIKPVQALLLSVGLLLMGNGLQGTLLPIRAGIDNFSTFDIGILGSSYFFGFATGCLIGPYMVRRAGHIRAFTGLVAIASTSALIHVMLPIPPIWWVFRAMTGLCFAALYMIIESWLNERSTNETLYNHQSDCPDRRADDADPVRSRRVYPLRHCLDPRLSGRRAGCHDRGPGPGPCWRGQASHPASVQRSEERRVGMSGCRADQWFLLGIGANLRTEQRDGCLWRCNIHEHHGYCRSFRTVSDWPDIRSHGPAESDCRHLSLCLGFSRDHSGAE